MGIITLTTDLGTRDSYLASVKGAIYSQLEDVKIVDISNHIEPFNIQQAAYVLRNCFKDFAVGTVHIISVDDELSITNEHLAVKADGHYFVG
ncbi:MAG: SAM-dependent chlorinase/fluorinase, partial [Bacteroidota bacterium]|nr:SAM-dependent chlorinase/fluorinase [Bacteroidota bacterium]